nr:PREDICTED: uncharacterized protein LOC106488004 [Apteryx mantelli mantelli]
MYSGAQTGVARGGLLVSNIFRSPNRRRTGGLFAWKRFRSLMGVTRECLSVSKIVWIPNRRHTRVFIGAKDLPAPKQASHEGVYLHGRDLGAQRPSHGDLQPPEPFRSPAGGSRPPFPPLPPSPVVTRRQPSSRKLLTAGLGYSGFSMAPGPNLSSRKARTSWGAMAVKPAKGSGRSGSNRRSGNSTSCRWSNHVSLVMTPSRA